MLKKCLSLAFGIIISIGMFLLGSEGTNIGFSSLIYNVIGFLLTAIGVLGFIVNDCEYVE